MVLSDCCISVIGGVVSKGGYSLDWIRPMLFKKRRSSLCHTGLSKAALQALAVTGSFSFQKSVESTAPGQACTLDSTKHHSPQWQLSGLSLFFAQEQMNYKVTFLHHFCRRSALFLAKHYCWQAARKGPIRSMLHPPWPCVAQMSHVCPAWLVLDASIWSHMCKSIAQHMGYTAHAQIQNRDLACLTERRARNIYVFLWKLRKVHGFPLSLSSSFD